jgi:hypothetical protein
LAATVLPEIIPFRVLTTFDNLSHLSALATFTITCGNSYTITEVIAPADPQYVTHGVATAGYSLPEYTHTAIAGCPLSIWAVSTSSGTLASHPGLKNTVATVSDVKTVLPDDMSLHTDAPYIFYAQITATGGSVAYHGPYSLYVGCTSSSVTISDNPSSQSVKNIHVGDAITDQFLLHYTTFSRAWCIN